MNHIRKISIPEPCKWQNCMVIAILFCVAITGYANAQVKNQDSPTFVVKDRSKNIGNHDLQQMTIWGMIMAEDELPVQLIEVNIGGIHKKTVLSPSGIYRVKIQKRVPEIFVFNFAGYLPVEIKVDSTTKMPLNILLKPDRAQQYKQFVAGAAVN